MSNRADYLNRIKSAVDAIDRGNLMVERQQALRLLVETYGIDAVAAASGLSVASVRVYIAKQEKTPKIGLEPLSQAATILSQVK